MNDTIFMRARQSGKSIEYRNLVAGYILEKIKPLKSNNITANYILVSNKNYSILCNIGLFDLKTNEDKEYFAGLEVVVDEKYSLEVVEVYDGA